MLEYQEIIVTSGVNIPFSPRIITPKIERLMRNNRYEAGECFTLRHILRPGDRFLELGGGLGLISTAAGLIRGVESITTVEANPELIELIKETHRLNNVTNVDLRHGVVTAEPGPPIAFYLRGDFWASSMDDLGGRYARKLDLPRQPIGALIAELNPTVISCDIEGGELGLFDNIDLSGVRAMILEFHPKVYGDEKLAEMMALIKKQGFVLGFDTKTGASVQYFHRPDPSDSFLPQRDYKSKPVQNPHILMTTFIQSNAPHLLEWVAWHKAMGVNDLVVFSKNCNATTTIMLNKLEKMGHLRHQPVSYASENDGDFISAAISDCHSVPEIHHADYFIATDPNEFLNIRPGQGRFQDLLDVMGDFDVLSISEIIHATDTNPEEQTGWLTESFTAHQSSRPGKWKARRQVRSLTRLGPNVRQLHPHRPILLKREDDVIWYDGSGRRTDYFIDNPEKYRHDVRNSFDHVRLERFAPRQAAHLDPTAADEPSSEYTIEDTSNYDNILRQAKIWYDRNFANDQQLMALHHKIRRAPLHA